MELPKDIINKIMLYNSHPVADLINSKIRLSKLFCYNFVEYCMLSFKLRKFSESLKDLEFDF